MIGKTFYSLKSCTAVKIQNGYSTIHAHQYRTACLTGPKKRFNDILFWLNSIFFYYAMFSELRQKKITFFMLVRNQGSLTPQIDCLTSTITYCAKILIEIPVHFLANIL